MAQHQPTRQRDLSWLETDPHWQDACKGWSLGAEYMLRVQAGQHPEVWEVHGGADSDTTLFGYTLLWVPEESIFLRMNCGLAPAWFYSPFTWDDVLRDLADPDCGRGIEYWYSELQYYRSWSTRCDDCGAFMTPADWQLALQVHDGTPSEVQCAVCFEAQSKALSDAYIE
jgi:hypothetical protein